MSFEAAVSSDSSVGGVSAGGSSSAADERTVSTLGAVSKVGVEWILGVMMVIAPLLHSGRPALMSLELLAVVVLMLVLLRARAAPISRVQAVGLLALVGLPLIYLIPLPAGLAGWLPGHAPYVAASTLLDEAGRSASLTLSLVPAATEAAWLFVWVPVAVFLGVRSLAQEALSRLALVLLVVALLESFLGAAQFLLSLTPPGAGPFLDQAPRAAFGTYASPTHLAGLLTMVLPIALALTAQAVERLGSRRGRRWREGADIGEWIRRYSSALSAAIVLVLLAGMLLTRSRAGIGLGMVAVVLWTLVLARRARNQEGLLGIPRGLLIGALGGLLVLALVPLFDRFALPGLAADSRLSILSGTLSGIAAFFPIGSGLGTFADVFPAFQPVQLGAWSVEHAHNDYLEWLFETGLFGAVLIAVGLVLYVRQWRRIGAGGPWSRLRFVQVGAGMGILLLLFDVTVDSNLPIPAGSVYFAALAGLFFSAPAVETESESRPRRHRRTPDLEPQEPSAARHHGIRARLSAAEQIANPFLDDEPGD